MANDVLSDDEEPTRGVIQADATERAIRAALAERVRSMIPARVDKVHLDGSGNLKWVDCKPLIGDFHRDETGKLVSTSVPIICSVPVVLLVGGGFCFTVPLIGGANGTLGMLIFSDRSMDRWLSGQGQEVVDPELYHRSALTDACFIPGLLPFGAPMDPAPPVDHATAGSVSGPRIHFRSNVITIGDESGSKKLGLDQDPVDAGTLTAVVGPPSGGLSPITITYTAPGGTPTPWLAFAGAGATPGTYSLALSGKLLASATQGKGK